MNIKTMYNNNDNVYFDLKIKEAVWISLKLEGTSQKRTLKISKTLYLLSSIPEFLKTE